MYTLEDISTLEIKPCGLGSRIWDMEAENYNWYPLLIGEHLDYFLFLFISRTGTVGWTEPWVKLPKCAPRYAFFGL